jgi:DNA polymerase (family 10)
MVKTVLAAGDNLIRLILDNNWQVDLKLATPEEWGSFIQHFTGSKEHNIHLREIALKKGYSLSEHGIKMKETGKLKQFADEKEFYHFLGFEWIPPAERVGGPELEKYLLKK